MGERVKILRLVLHCWVDNSPSLINLGSVGCCTWSIDALKLQAQTVLSAIRLLANTSQVRLNVLGHVWVTKKFVGNGQWAAT